MNGLNNLVLGLGAKAGNTLAGFICYNINGAEPTSIEERVQNYVVRSLCYIALPHYLSQKYSQSFLSNFTKIKAFTTLVLSTAVFLACVRWGDINEKDDDDPPLPGLNSSTLVRSITAISVHLFCATALMGLSKMASTQLTSFLQSRLFSALNRIPFLSV